jgi:hypothetical protein
VGFGEALLRIGRIDAHGVIFGADAAHETGDQPPAREIVEDGVFFRHHQRIVEKRQRAAENRELGALDAAREHAGEHARNRHHAVCGLVMLVQADAVETERVGIFHLVEIFVVEAGALFGIVMAVRIGDPGRAVALDRIEIGVPIGHQVEIEKLHAVALRPLRKLASAVRNASRCSTCGKCPQSGMIASVAPGMSFW